jgi:peroxiredoxin family protein
LSEPLRLAIIAQQASHNRLHALVSLTSTTVALGGEVCLFLTHEALKAFLSTGFDACQPNFNDPDYQAFYTDAIEMERIPSLDALFLQAREKGRVRLFACQASVQLWRRYEPEQLDRLEAVIGHSTFLNMVRGFQLLVL